MSTPVSSKVINASFKDLRSSFIEPRSVHVQERDSIPHFLRSSSLAVRSSLMKPREISSIREPRLVDRTESKIVGSRGERLTTPSFSRYSSSSERIETEDGWMRAGRPIGGVVDSRYEGRPNFIVFN